MDFLGTFDYAMDERGRVPLPPRYRDAFRDGVVLSQGSPDRCLLIYPAEDYARQSRQVKEQPLMGRASRVLRRAHFGRSHHAELDKQNRVLIPAPLREFAGLTGKVMVMGSGECLEVWSPAEYDAEMARVDEELPDAQESAARTAR